MIQVGGKQMPKIVRQQLGGEVRLRLLDVDVAR